MNKIVMLSAAFLGLTWWLSPIQGADHTKDAPESVRKAVADGKAVLLDVREETEWNAGHLKGARLVPLSDLEAGMAPEVLAKKAPKGKVVYCHCAAGGRALLAADILEKLGYDVRPLKPGYKELLKAGFEAAPR